jgi:hypothetical protein
MAGSGCQLLPAYDLTGEGVGHANLGIKTENSRQKE